jgi:hypothetical protein
MISILQICGFGIEQQQLPGTSPKTTTIKGFLQQSKSSKSSFRNQRAQFFRQSKSIPPASKENTSSSSSSSKSNC